MTSAARTDLWARTKSLLKRTPVRRLHNYFRRFAGMKSQSQEGVILQRLLSQVVVPKSFVEFGFHLQEFNCSGLIKDYRGLLIDGNVETVRDARDVLPRNVRSECHFLTLDNIHVIGNHFASGHLGVLSIDVDGNDYWFLGKLLEFRPGIIVVEYNASFGTAPLSVPYDPGFIRHEKHASGWYHGASITAIARLAERHGYDLVEVEANGVNLFFLRSDIRPASIPKLSPESAYRENRLRNQWSGTKAADQWQAIRHLPYVSVG